MNTKKLGINRLAVVVAALAGTGGCAHQPGMMGSVQPVERVQGRDAEVQQTDPYGAAKAHFLAGDYGLAADGFQKVLARNPASIRALNGLGASFDKLERYRLAQAYYYRALNLDSDSVQTLNNLGYSLLLQQRYGEAVQILQTARNLDGGNARVRRNLAMAQERLFAGLEKDDSPSTTGPAAEPEVHPEPAPPPDRPAIRRVAAKPDSSQAAAAEAPFDPEPGLSAFQVEIANGNGRNGMAYLTSRFLRTRGVEVADISNAGSFGHETTQVFYRPGFERAARRTAALLQLTTEPRRLPAGRLETEVRVVLGRDFMVFDQALRTAVLDDTADRRGRSAEDAEPMTLAAAIEISNGNGRTGMAAMVGRALGADGGHVARLTNAGSFDHTATTVYYRPAGRREAERIAQWLPVDAKLVESDGMRRDIGVRVVIGRDLLAHEAGFRRRSRSHG